MKKIFAVLLCAMLVTSTAALSVSAYDSPTIKPGDSDTDPFGGSDDDSDRSRPGKDTDTDSSNKGKDSDSDSNSSKTSESKSTSSSTTSTSPKTGAPVSYGVLMAAAALAFGGIAVSSKKKIEE